MGGAVSLREIIVWGVKNDPGAALITILLPAFITLIVFAGVAAGAF